MIKTYNSFSFLGVVLISNLTLSIQSIKSRKVTVRRTPEERLTLLIIGLKFKIFVNFHQSPNS